MSGAIPFVAEMEPYQVFWGSIGILVVLCIVLDLLFIPDGGEG